MTDETTKKIEERSMEEVARFWQMRSQGYQAAAEMIVCRLAEGAMVGAMAIESLKQADQKAGVPADTKLSELIDQMIEHMTKAFPVLEGKPREEQLEIIKKIAEGGFL